MAGRRRARLLSMCLLLAAGLAGPATAAAQRYAVVDLGILGAERNAARSSVLGINNCGQIVGGGRAANVACDSAFIWEDCAITGLGRCGLPCSRSSGNAFGINDLGTVVGACKSEDTHSGAFLWHDGVMTSLHAADGRTTGWSYAYAINTRNQVVGTSSREDGTAAVIWKNGVMKNLLPAQTWAEARDINASGEVVGTYRTPGDETVPPPRAFLWRQGDVVELGDLGGGWSTAVAINDLGQIAGTAGTTTVETGEDPIWYAFLWQDGGMREITGGPETRTSATDLNNSGQVVGNATDGPPADADRYAFVYGPDLGFRDLNTLMPAKFDWHLEDAVAINDLGQIVAEGWSDSVLRFFLLTPVSSEEDAIVLV